MAAFLIVGAALTGGLAAGAVALAHGAGMWLTTPALGNSAAMAAAAGATLTFGWICSVLSQPRL